MFTRILVPTDFSTTSDAALAYGRILARRFDVPLHILHVVENELVTGPLGTEMYVPFPPRTGASLLEEAQARLTACITPEDRASLRITADTIVGTAARTITEYARGNGYDLIVMGTHGRSGLAHLLMGSVAEHVVRAASCPVLTVPTMPAPAALRVAAGWQPAPA